MTAPSVPAGDVAKLVERITGYLTSGGLFNPELADHEAVRDMLIECRAGFESLSRDLAEARAALEPFARADAEINDVSWLFDMFGKAVVTREAVSRARSVLSTQPKETPDVA